MCEEVDFIYRKYYYLISDVFKKYSGKNKLPGQDNFMSLEEFDTLIHDLKVINMELVERDINVCFNLSVMTQVDELHSERHLQMKFVEYLEALARVADLANIQTPF